MSKTYHLIPFFFFLVVLAIYWPGLSGPLMLDDGPKLIPLINTTNHINWYSYLKEFVFNDSRPIAMLSFVINALLSSDKIWLWKLTNVFLHGLTGYVIYQFTWLILETAKFNDSQKNKVLSLFIAFIWLVHPLQVSTVLYLVQRMTILATLFTFSALLLFVLAFKKEIEGKSNAIYLVTSILVLFPLALLSKQIAALFPIYILLISQFLSTRLNINKTPRNIKFFVQLMRVFIVIGVIGFIIYFDSLTNGYNTRNFTLFERLITEPRVVFFYLNQIIFPLPANMGFFHDDFIISTNIITPYSTLAAIIGLVSIGFILALKSKSYPSVALGLLFYLVSQLLESTVLPLEIAFEHRNYIGLWGITFSVTLFLHNKLKNYVFITFIALILCGVSFYRTNIWGNGNKMYPQMAAIHPDSKRLKIIFADSYLSARQYDKALKSLENIDGLGVKLNRLSILCKKQSKLKEGAILKTLDNVTNKIGEYESEGIIQLANLGLDNQCTFKKVEFIKFLDIIEKLPFSKKITKQKILLYKAHYLYVLGEKNKAILALESSYNQDPVNPIPLFLMIEWLIENHQIQNAATVFVKAKKIANKSIYDYTDFIERINSLLLQ